MSDYILPVCMYGSCYSYLSIYYYKPEVVRNIMAFINCIHSIILPYLYVYENINTHENIEYWCIAYYIYDSVLSLINIYYTKEFKDFGYLLHHIVTMYLLHNANNVVCMKAYFEFECTNLFLFLGLYLERNNNKNLVFCKFAHIIMYAYLRLIGGYHILLHFYKYMDYQMCIGALFLYILCWAGMFALIIETKDVIKKIM